MGSGNIYNILYEKTSSVCREYHVLMPYSKRVFNNWVGKDPLALTESEFYIYLDDDDPTDVLTNIMFRCMIRFLPDHISNVYGRVMKVLKKYDPPSIVNVMIRILHYSSEAKECRWTIRWDGGHKRGIREIAAVHSFLFYQLVAGYYYTVIRGRLLPAIKHSIIEPFWDRFSADSKNRMRRLVGRTEKP